MSKLGILLLGSKEYPFGSGQSHEKKPSGGIEVHVEKLAKYLSKDGHRVFLITRKFPGQKERESRGNIKIYRTGFVNNKFLRTVTFNRASMKLAKEIFEKEKIDVIHAHGPVAGSFASKLSKDSGIPMVFTPHGTITGWGPLVRTALNRFMKKSINGAKKTIFVSYVAQKEAKKSYGSFPNKLIPNAVDPDDYPKTKRSWKETRFLFLGRLERVKGIRTILESFKILSKEFPKSRLYIAGEGTMKQEIRDFVSKNSLSKNVKLLGWVPAPEALSKADVFLLPSWETGQPIALLEAMATGKVIITSLPYITEKTGIKIKPKDPEDLSKKMLDVYKNLKKYESLGKAAQTSIRKDYTWNKTSKLIENVYRDVSS